ncbi:putative ribosomally synthesized peptide with SipW-like signal peptide [Thermodesulfitimonas autotrophica]|uniref:Putative ribosomally synthesized peptide with SipW-like signal peptide n=1 Tax=Thermodesulfitimonas autotrophica TaxID=1894989 RepID=A0A3N5ADW5_9THEO|nr:TasA family protein [Thermodesulfitimonas autotrophica]RPF43056.1 putative ribosomally synthesized peptide with SipW-like signal peptide [Thermodesulfitimonas autotrophica]
MKKKVLLLALTLLLVAGMTGYGTWAYFADTEQSLANTFAAGTLDLKVSDDNQPFGDGVSETWVLTNMAPGDVPGVAYEVSLMNTGSLAGSHVEIAFSHAIDEALNPVESDTNRNSTWQEMARYIEIQYMDYDGIVFTGAGATSGHAIVDANDNGWLDLEDVTLPANAAALDNLPTPLPNGGNTKSFHVRLAFRPEAGNDLQGDRLTTTVTFTLNQDASQ